uniref:Uncharacterized protein n=1 Tax=Dictyoglomus thermophilum TaxID=14 RepID=A0A7C3RN05_DICTH
MVPKSYYLSFFNISFRNTLVVITPLPIGASYTRTFRVSFLIAIPNRTWKEFDDQLAMWKHHASSSLDQPTHLVSLKAYL